MSENDSAEILELLTVWPAFVREVNPKGVAAHAMRKIEREADALLLGRLSPRDLSRHGDLISALPARRQAWAEARRCEIELQQRLSASDIHSSVSHSGGWVVAIGTKKHADGGQNALKGVGVDLERKARRVSAGIRARLLSPAETRLPLTLLEFWTIKEACFKAMPDNHATVLSDYIIQQITQDGAGFNGVALCRASSVEARIVFRSVGGDSWLVALAIIS